MSKYFIIYKLMSINKFSALTIAYFYFSDWLKNSDYEPLVGVLPFMENEQVLYLQFCWQRSLTARRNVYILRCHDFYLLNTK